MDEPVKNDPQASTVSARETTIIAALIIITQIVIALISYPFLPASVPSHWNAAGQVNGYMSKEVNAILWPAISLGIFILVRGLIALGPALGSSRANAASNLRATKNIANLIVIAVMLFMLVLQIATTAIGLGIPLDLLFILNIALSILFIFIGNFLGKVPRNLYVGIRTPWTMVNDDVWNRTHRLGGWLFVAAGLLGLGLGFVPGLKLWGLVVAILIAALITVVYSYIVYKEIEGSGRDPVSPPFN